MAGKQHRHPFPGDFSDATEPGDVIHSDVFGPLPPSHSGFCYLVTFIDEFTHYVTIFAMLRKSDVLRCFQLFVREFERLHNTTVKTIHSDNGGGYAPVAKYAFELGIAVQRSAPYTPQSNGIAELQNRSIFEMARTSLAASGLSRNFWVEAVKNAVHIRNRLPDATGVSPFEKIFGRAPSATGFRPLGCLSYMLQHDSLRRRLEDKSLLCVLLANLEHGNYRLLELSTNKVHVSRHVVSDENVFPARTKTSEDHRLADTNSEILSEVELSQRITDSDGQQTHTSSGITEPSEVNDADSDIAENSVHASEDDAVLDNADEIADGGSENSSASAGSAVVEEEEDNSHSTTESRYPSRYRRPPGAWWAFQANSKDCHLSQIQ
jgi:transposase InsO family protein